MKAKFVRRKCKFSRVVLFIDFKEMKKILIALSCIAFACSPLLAQNEVGFSVSLKKSNSKEQKLKVKESGITARLELGGTLQI